jgi:tyrosyl-tRNA synthetase
VKPERGGFDENEEVDRAITAKMSKSRPWTCLFIHDTKEQLAEKMKKAWCPEKTVADNGVLEYVRHVVFHEFKTLAVERPAKFGGPVEYASYAEVEQDFAAGNMHPMDLKAAVTDYIDRIIAPFREHFQKPAKAKLLEVYEGTEITR